jgi:hypothetical protein
MKVQAWLAEETSVKPSMQIYEAINCPACTQLHFVNRSTGKLLGDGNK